MTPRLTVSEACHRLALSEGPKENKTRINQMETGDKKMIKKAIACLLIMILAMAILAVQLVSSTVHHVDGRDYSYLEYLSDPINHKPWYCECNHDTFPRQSDNTEVGLGIEATYVNWYFFYWAWWDFNAEFGDGDVAMISGLSIDPCVNGDDHHYWTYYGSPVWTTPPGAWYQCWYVDFQLDDDGPVETGLVTSVEGSTTAAFYHPSDPPWPPTFGDLWWLDAYTQNPSYYPNGNGWSFLTAWPGT
jgi:hypothetical protein